jgi:hypothetical protein
MQEFPTMAVALTERAAKEVKKIIGYWLGCLAGS